MRFAGSWLANLPWISIFAFWNKCEKSNPRSGFENGSSLRGSNKIPYPCSSESVSNTSFYTQCLHRFYSPKCKATWVQTNQDFSIIASCRKPAQIELHHACLPRLPYLTHAAFRFASWSTATKQTGDKQGTLMSEHHWSPQRQEQVQSWPGWQQDPKVTWGC